MKYYARTRPQSRSDSNAMQENKHMAIAVNVPSIDIDKMRKIQSFA